MAKALAEGGVALMVVLDGASLTIESLAAVAEGRDTAILAPAARNRMAEARKVVEEALRSEAAVYGLTTAVAERKRVTLDAAGRRGFSQTLIRNDLIAQGTLPTHGGAGRDGLPGERLRQGVRPGYGPNSPR